MRSTKTIEPAMTTLNASKITTSTMATNTSKYTTINDSVIHHDKESSVLLTALLSSGGVILLIVIAIIGVFLKRRRTMYRSYSQWHIGNRKGVKEIYECTVEMKDLSEESRSCFPMIENEFDDIFLPSILPRTEEKKSRLPLSCLTADTCQALLGGNSSSTKLTQCKNEIYESNDQQTVTSYKHIDGGIEEYKCNKSRHELTVIGNESEDKIQPSMVSNAEEKSIPLLGGNSSPTKLTQFNKSNDQQTFRSHKQLVKECPVSVENDDNLKISIVQPLTGPVQEQNKDSSLNWDEIFRYLAKHLTTSDYKLFFNILYGSCHHLQGGGDRDTGSFIEKVETRVRRDGGDSETLMFELFKQWKQIMGSNVSTEYIEEALRERSNNLLLEKFKEFMRMPPLLPMVLERKKFQPTFHMITKPNCGDEMLQFFPYNEIRNTCYMLPNASQCMVLPLANEGMRNTVDLTATREFSNTVSSATGEINNTTNGPVIEEIGEHDMDLSSLTGSSSSSGQLSDRFSVLSSGEIIVKRKRMHVNRDIMIYGNEDIPNKLKKIDASVVPLEKTKTRRQRKQHKSTTALDLHNMTQSMISLMKQFLPLSPIPLDTYQYSVFLEYTIGSVTKQTGESRNTVLSLSFSAYCETETFKTKRNDTFYFMYVKDRCLMLGHEEFENLRLYADFARRNLVREITKQNGGKYKAPEALFLSYDGTPFLKKKKLVRALKKTAQEAKSLSEASLDEFPTASSTRIPEKYDSTVRENNKDHVTPINQKMDPVTCLEDTVGLTNTKMDCSFFEVVSKGSENPAPGQHFNDVKDIMDNGSIDIINYEHKIPYLGDDSEKETSKAFSLKENDEAVEIEDLKVQAADCTLAPVVSGATNVTLQDQIVSDTNICDMVPENAQGKRESEIMFACLSCLIQNEIHNDPKSPGTFLPIELD